MSNLSDRIALILQSEPASDAVEAIIAEARDELGAVERRHAEARAVVVDPLAGSAAVTRARREAEDLPLTRERLTVALEHLERALAAAQTREENARRMVAYEAVSARREAVICDLREHYPRLAGELVTLLQRLQAVEAEVERLQYPDGVPRFGSVEVDARRVPANWYSPSMGPIGQLATSVRLPAFDGGPHTFWPPNPLMAGASAAVTSLEPIAAARRAQRVHAERVAAGAA